MDALKRLVAAILTFTPFGIYVFFIQLIYDKTEVVEHPQLKAILFFSALIGGAATYDFVKTALFLPSEQFRKFFDGVLGAWLSMGAFLLFVAIAALILNYQSLLPSWAGFIEPWIGHVSYIISFVPAGFFIRDVIRSIEAATA